MEFFDILTWPMKKEYTNGLLSLIVLCIVAIGCSAITDGKPAAESAVVEFHSMLNDGKYTEIYAATDERLKEVSSEEDMLKIFNAVHTKLGLVKNSTAQSWKAANYNLTTTIVIVQATEFEKGKGTETFTFVIADKKATLAGYYIESIDMMTN